ncbi:MAG: thioredoxin [Candidatus Lokiarchaeota archaeon]|nr:thioredoxin [Candidatus Lokiarchaeota archaeon]
MSREVIPPTVEDLKALGIEIPLKGKAVLDIFTEWCGPCKTIGPILHTLEKEGEISLVQEDLDKNRPLAENHCIQAIPTLIFFKDGKRIGDVPGDSQELTLKEFFKRATQGQLDVNLSKDGSLIEDLSNYKVTLNRFLIKDGVMVGFPGEEVLRKLIKEM